VKIFFVLMNRAGIHDTIHSGFNEYMPCADAMPDLIIPADLGIHQGMLVHYADKNTVFHITRSIRL